MRKRWPIYLACFALVGGVAALRAWLNRPVAVLPHIEVADWPQLPPGVRFGRVLAVAADAENHIYVTHEGKPPVLVFDAAGRFLRSWDDGLLQEPHGLCIDGQGNVWIAEVKRHQVVKYDRHGQPLLVLGKKDQPGWAADQFDQPTEVAVSSTGLFYVSDGYGNSRVAKFSGQGQYLKEWGKKGDAPGEFNLPHAIVLDSQGRIYVGDRENSRIQIFDDDGQFIGQWHSGGTPYGLCITAAGRLLVADGRANQVMVLDLNGKALGRFGMVGTEPGPHMVHAVCVDSRGAVYVTDYEGRRVRKYLVNSTDLK